MSVRSLKAQWERTVLAGLALEWERARRELPQQIGEALQRPTFRLSDLRSHWGYWDGSTRQIVLSRHLAKNYPWDSVCEILLHEMAHQLAEQAFAGADQPPHGDAFKDACALIQANPAASGSYPLLEERIRSGAGGPRDKMALRIDKLMSLAQSSHRHEAEAAMLKAHELIAKYNIELIDKGGQPSYISAFAGKPALRHFLDAYRLANLLQDCYFVSGIWVPAFVMDKQKMGRVLEISGTPKNVSLARHVHAVLERTVRTEWDAFKTAQNAPAAARVDFAIGLIDGFKARIEKQSANLRCKPESKHLIMIEDPHLTAYCRKRYPRVRKFSRGGRRRHARIESAGNRIGSRLVIAKAMTDKPGHSDRLLPPAKKRQSGR